MAAKQIKKRGSKISSTAKQGALLGGLVALVAEKGLAEARSLDQSTEIQSLIQGSLDVAQEIEVQADPAALLTAAEAPAPAEVAQDEAAPVAQEVAEQQPVAADSEVVAAADDMSTALSEAVSNELVLEAAGQSGADASAAGAATTVSPLMALGAVALAGIAAAGSSSSSSSSVVSKPVTPAPVAASGEAMTDGYLSGATVERVNGSGNKVTTDSKGAFTGLTGTGAIKITGGLVGTTPFKGILYAPEGATVVTPLTTLVYAQLSKLAGTSGGLAAAKGPLEDAIAAIKASLGLPADFDLLNVDPVESAATNPAAFAALKAGAKVGTLLNALGASGADAFEAAATALAARLASSNGVVDLSDTSFLSDLMNEVSADLGRDLGLSIEELNALATGFDAIDSADTLDEVGNALDDIDNAIDDPNDTTDDNTDDATDDNTDDTTDDNTDDTTDDNTDDTTDDGTEEETEDNTDDVTDAPAGEVLVLQSQLADLLNDPAFDGFDDASDVTLKLDVVDGTHHLGTSLQELSDLGIDRVIAGDNTTAVIDGIGGTDVDLSSLGLIFSPGLGVTLDLVADDSSGAEGTMMNGSLTDLNNIGIDMISGAMGADLTITGGVGAADFDTSSISFDQYLNVTVEVSLDEADNYTGGLDALAADLSNIVGVDSVALVDADFADASGTTLAESGVTLDHLGSLGIDSLDATDGADNLNIQLGVATTDAASVVTALQDALVKFNGSVFMSEDEVNLQIDNFSGNIADVLTDTVTLPNSGPTVAIGAAIEMLGIDSISDDTGELWHRVV